LEYESSLQVDEDLLDAAGILPYQAVVCSNVNNGERFMTYAMMGERGSGKVVLNGPTARKGAVGDWLNANTVRSVALLLHPYILASLYRPFQKRVFACYLKDNT